MGLKEATAFVGEAPSRAKQVSVPSGRRFDLTAQNPGFRWNIHVFLWRRLSELRDNYLSKNPNLLTAAKTLQRLFLT
jgi:hypothetical protein